MGRISSVLVGAVVGVVAALAATRWMLARQAAIARRRIGKPLGEQALDADRVWRKRLAGDPADLLVLGDSIAAGLGADRPKETLGARLAKDVARELGRPVRLRSAAVVGSESSALEAQIAGLDDGYRPDVAVIIVGGNDVTHRVPTATSAEHLRHAIRQLRARGAAVVVGTCPDLGALRAVPQPLRALAAQQSRQLARAQEAVAVDEGAVPVSLRAAVGAVFSAQPDDMFSLDRFHPSALGYRRTAEALAPVVTDRIRASSSRHPQRPSDC
ncbi:SGNH/GDSL hydrolase family protein [Microbacterium koreense]|uniref:SGNH/GDSL hydrolase family protein n=1 Tax=Microbacterium koreense TaxID=323761 RepID=A0ABW2ZR32_9MICO